MKTKRLSLAGAIICLSALMNFTSAREFTSTDGKKINAEVVAIKGDQVTLKIGVKNYTVAMSKFSEEDAAYFKQWQENELKNRIPDLEVRVNTGKSNRADRNDTYDDRTGSFQFSIEVENEERNFNVEGASAKLAVIGEDAGDRKKYVVMQQNSFSVDILEGETFKWEGKKLHYKFDDSHPAVWGTKYYGYVFQIKNKSGKVIFSKSNPKKFEGHEAKIFGFKYLTAFDDSGEKRGTGSIYKN